MKPSEVREKTTEELARKAAELKEEVFRLSFRAGGGHLKQTANIRATRKDLARVKTEIRAREIKDAKGGA